MQEMQEMRIWFLGREDPLECVAVPLGDLPDRGIEPASLVSPSLAAGFFTTSATWEALRVSGLPEAWDRQ